MQNILYKRYALNIFNFFFLKSKLLSDSQGCCELMLGDQGWWGHLEVPGLREQWRMILWWRLGMAGSFSMVIWPSQMTPMVTCRLGDIPDRSWLRMKSRWSLMHPRFFPSIPGYSSGYCPDCLSRSSRPFLWPGSPLSCLWGHGLRRTGMAMLLA